MHTYKKGFITREKERKWNEPSNILIEIHFGFFCVLMTDVNVGCKTAFQKML